MSAHKDGGPAFPTDYHAACPECHVEMMGATSHGGMTLRDYFAAQSILGTLANPNSTAGGRPIEEALPIFAAFAYQMADAMLAAREAA